MAQRISDQIRNVSDRLRAGKPAQRIPIDFVDSEEMTRVDNARHSLPVRAAIGAFDGFKSSSLPVQILIALATLIATATGLVQALAPLFK